jgi:tight adherence protein B
MTNMPLLVALLAGVAGAAALLGLARLVYSPARRIGARFAAIAPAEIAFDVNLLRDRSASTFGPLDALLRRSEWTARTRIVLDRAGLPLRVGEWVMIQVGAGVAGALLGVLLGRLISAAAVSILIVPAMAAAGAYIPAFYLRRKITQRARRIDSQLVQLCELMASMMASGFGYIQALGTASERLLPPLSDEVRTMLEAISLGADIDEALQEMNQRLDNQDFDIIATAITIQRSTGGRLGDILQGVADTIRDRQSLSLEIRALTSQQRFGAVIVTLLPFAIVAGLNVLMPEPFGRLFTEPAGRLLLGLAIAMDALAFVVIRRLGRIEY